MSELKVYVHPLKTNILGQTIVGQSYYLKSEADKVIADKDAKILQYKVLYKELCRDINNQERHFAKQLYHQKYKRCLAMASLWLERSETSTDLENELVSRKRCNKWLELAEKFKEAK